ncbi:MAG TPA: NAD-dependent dehydratase [Lentisphaeria bacterium]|nr:MAG: NAD-dependent dehydratase [Lentisphaerae bacterium GWF2_50_93]HCE42556.1 NAD-dependent dehydratase [Lentisphaeria bacterium]
MKILFIGGTGVISSACSELAVRRGIELHILNRGLSKKIDAPKKAVVFHADIRKEPEKVSDYLENNSFDAVVDWVAFTPENIEQDIKVFTGKTKQFVFISSATVYQKPPRNYIITENTPLGNPFSDYATNKIACEKRLMQEYKRKGFPVTIIRPSLTYGLSQIPLCIGSWNYPYTVINRMKKGKQVIVPGDGTSLWTVTWNADFAKGLVGLLGNKKAIGEAFHMTSDEVLCWNQIYKEAGKAAGVEPRLVHIPTDLLSEYIPRLSGSLIGDKINSIVFDNSKIREFVPDFKCEVKWAEGVRKAVRWHERVLDRSAIDKEADRTYDKIISAYRRAFPK